MINDARSLDYVTITFTIFENEGSWK